MLLSRTKYSVEGGRAMKVQWRRKLRQESEMEAETGSGDQGTGSRERGEGRRTPYNALSPGAAI